MSDYVPQAVLNCFYKVKLLCAGHAYNYKKKLSREGGAQHTPSSMSHLEAPPVQAHYEALANSEREGELIWHNHSVPKCAYSEAVMEYVRKLPLNESKAPLRAMEQSAVMVWKHAVKANIVLWSFWLIYPFVCYWWTSCEGKGFASADWQLLLLYLPALAAALYLEIKCHAVVLPAYVSWLGGYKVLGFAIPFPLYFAVGITISVAAHLDLATNGIFLARLVRTSQCIESDVSGIWKATVENSSTPFLPSLHSLCFCCWIGMLLQLLSSLLVSFPKENSRNDFDIDLKGLLVKRRSMILDQEKVNAIQSLSGQVFPSDAVDSLATSARMYLLTFRHLSFLEVSRKPRLNDGPRARRTWVLTIQKVTQRCLFCSLFESATMANIQASTIAVAKASSSGDVDHLTVFSISLSLCMAGWQQVCFAKEIYKLVQDIRPHIDRQREDEEPEQPARNKRLMLISVGIFLIASSLCWGSVFYAALKLYAAVFLCPDGVWNFARQLQSGCVLLTEHVLK